MKKRNTQTPTHTNTHTHTHTHTHMQAVLQGGCQWDQAHFEVSIIRSLFIVCLCDSFVCLCVCGCRVTPALLSPQLSDLSHTLALSLSPSALPIPSFSVCASSWGGIDGCLSAQATLKQSIAWWLWRLCCGSGPVCFAEVAECHWEQRGRHSGAVLHGGLIDQAQS